MRYARGAILVRMRTIVLMLALAAGTAGCGSADRAESSEEAPHTASAENLKPEPTVSSIPCRRPTAGFRVCTDYVESRIEVRRQGRWRTFVTGFPGEVGESWERVIPSPDRRWLLAQTHAGCDLGYTWIVSTRTGRGQEVISGGSDSRVLGWSSDGRARFRLLTPYDDLRPGLYLVDPVTLAVKRQRPSPAGIGC